MSKWIEVAARRYQPEKPLPPYVGRVDGVMARVDAWRQAGLVVVTNDRTNNGVAIYDRLLVWPKAASVEAELDAIAQIGRRKLHNAIAVDIEANRTVLVLREDTLDARVASLMSSHDGMVPLDRLVEIEQYGMTPRPVVRAFSSGMRLEHIRLERTSHGVMDWPVEIGPKIFVSTRWRELVMRAISRRYQ